MIVRIGSRFVNTDYIVTGHTTKEKEGEHLTITMTEGEVSFTGNEADYLRTILDAMHFTEVRELSDRLPKPDKKEEEDF